MRYIGWRLMFDTGIISVKNKLQPTYYSYFYNQRRAVGINCFQKPLDVAPQDKTKIFYHCIFLKLNFGQVKIEWQFNLYSIEND